METTKAQPMIQKLRDRAIFFREFFSRFETTGSLIPSSRFVAQTITRQLSQRGEEPIRILECGPGTGPFTDRIVRMLRPGDSFDIVEVNESFVRVLRRRLETEPHWQAVADLTTIHSMPLQEFSPSEPYDFIISGLPHINFPTAIVEDILSSYVRLLKPGGTLSYFEYMHIRPIRKVLTLGADRKRVREVDYLMNQHLTQHLVSRDSVVRNFPPAWIQHATAQRNGNSAAGE